MEMPSLWKPQIGFHRDLEISPRTRDSHIPTADPSLMDTEKERTGPEQKCYPCIRSDLLPMFPVAQGREHLRPDNRIVVDREHTIRDDQ